MIINGEEAKVIPYAKDYAITKNGDVYRLTYRNRDSYFPIPPKKLKQKTRKDGYNLINLTTNGKRITKYTHRLLLEVFVGQCPDGMESSHLNNIRNDNRLENLKWETKPENEFRKIAFGTLKKGESMPNSKLKDHHVIGIKALIKAGYNNVILGKWFGVIPQTISAIKCGKRWTHIK